MVAELLPGGLLRQLDQLRLRPNRLLSGPQRGELRSRKQGLSLEFADYREYVPGDDDRRIDWHVAARTDQLYIRRFEGEENIRVDLIIDQSRSMRYGDPEKLHYARMVGTALGYVALRNGHQVNLVTFADGIVSQSPVLSGPRAAGTLFRLISDIEPGGQTRVKDALVQRSLEQPYPGMSFILSDWYDDASWQEGIDSLARAGRVIHLLHTLSPQERDPGIEGAFDWVDAETGERLQITLDSATHDLYTTALAQWCEAIERFCVTRGVRYLPIHTEVPIRELLLLTLRREGVLL